MGPGEGGDFGVSNRMAQSGTVEVALLCARAVESDFELTGFCSKIQNLKIPGSVVVRA